MIEIQDVTQKFGSKIALDNISLSLKLGEIVALIGENGAGKSTLMRIICDYIKSTSGYIKIFDYDIEISRIHALRYVGYVPEISSLYGDMTVFDFLKWIAGLWNITDWEAAITNAAKQMQIVDVLADKIETLSKGYKKRVEIASAILHQPKILILDEPTDGLDPNQKQHIRDFMKSYAKDNLVLVSTHVLEDAGIANRVVMLSHGKLIGNMTMKDFKKISHTGDLNEAFKILSSAKKEKK